MDSSSPTDVRKPDHPVAPFFIERWSPRAFRPVPISEGELMTMLEAARWAASSGNAQPWRFVYARRETSAWPTLLDLLTPNNRGWAQNASALVFFVSNTKIVRDGKPVDSPTHTYDTGTASGYFVMQALHMGWHTHGMYGFDHEKAPSVLRVPADHQVEAVYAVGRIGERASLPEALQAREVPSQRRPLSELAHEGAFSG